MGTESVTMTKTCPAKI